MDARHELDHARMAGYMDSSNPNAQQLRPNYGDLGRSPGDAATLSAAYHSRYLASMPLSTGSTFPFLGSMFAGPPSPFRAPSTPGVNNMRFWPPTPPPDGYGRYSMNTSLFPLFGAPSPDSGAYLSQGLVSRIGSTTHLSPVIDHKEHSFFTHGIGLGSPLTPSSHVTSPSPFPHLIPSLERHPAYIGHMTMGSKELEDCYNEEILKSHMDCLMKQDRPPSRKSSKSDGKNCCDKVLSDDCCKLNSKSGKESKGHHQQPMNKVHPCKIEVSHSPALKPDLLSPPIDSPKPERASPCKTVKKNAVAPVQHSNHKSSLEPRCSQCCGSMKDTVVGSKTMSHVVSTAVVTPTMESYVSKNCSVSSTVATVSMANSDSRCSPVGVAHSQRIADHSESKHNNQKLSRTSPVITITDTGERPSDPVTCKPRSTSETIPTKSCNIPTVPFKHVTAAVIPTAPKQAVHREIHPEINCMSVQDLTKEPPTMLSSEANSMNSEKHNIKLETNDVSTVSDKTASLLNQSSFPVCTAPMLKSQNKNLSTSCKVKDMIRNATATKHSAGDKLPEVSPSKNAETDGCSRGLLPNSPSKPVPFNVLPNNSLSPTNLTKSPPQPANKPPMPSSPVMKVEGAGLRQDCEFTQKSASWTKATVMPFSWQNSSGHDDQAINLTVSKKPFKPELSEALNQTSETQQPSPVKVTAGSAVNNTEVVGVCHPNLNPVAVNKVKGTPAVSSISNFSAISVVNQPAEQSTEVHIMHRSSKSSFPIVNRNATPPVPLKGTISHVTANTSIHRSVKAERLTSKRGKLGDSDKMNHSRAALATLAPKLSKGMGFGKDVQTSHTLSTSSSVSSTSIVFPGTVNPCIPVGIAIAQQRQDTTNIVKSQQSVPLSTPNVITPNHHLTNSRVAADIQAQEILVEQKNQELSCSNNPTPVDTNLLVTQGPTIVSRQWESEALTRTAIPSSPWLAHNSMVAPAVWLGQNAYTAAPAPNPVPSIAMNPLEPSPISLPPGGYQLARDISGHLLLIPTANIELMDRSPMWPSFNTSAGNLPIQQLVTQQQHTQFEQVLPHTETIKTETVDNCNLDLSSQQKTEEKVEDISGQVPSVPLATGQTYAFTTFPTQCDPSSFSYVLQSSTVMHLAHTQTAQSITTESGRRSQGTSPLHCATPSPPPTANSCSVQVTEDEEESDMEAAEHKAPKGQSVTMAIQVDMDSQTNSEAEEDEHKMEIEKLEEQKVEMSDSANQTESVASESPKSDRENDAEEMVMTETVNCQSLSSVVQEEKENQQPPAALEKPAESQPENVVCISIKDDIVHSEPGTEIALSETELAPSLPVESKPVMDFIDQHGLNLLVDSIEEFASREQEETPKVADAPAPVTSQPTPVSEEIKDPVVEEKPVIAPKEEPKLVPEKFNSQYKTIDPSCTDGLGLLCALAEQRFFEEALNSDENKSKLQSNEQDSVASVEGKETKADVTSSMREQSNSNDSFLSSCSSSQDYKEESELDMRARLAELQKKYREKQRELELLKNQREREASDDEYFSNSPKPLKTSTPIKNHSKSSPNFREHLLKNSISKAWPKKQKKSESATEKDNLKKMKAASKAEKEYAQKEEEHGKIPSITLVHETSATISNNDSNASSGYSNESHAKKANRIQNYNAENSLESVSCTSKDESCSQDQDYDKHDKTKTPVFDETAWFVRRSERIFLSDAKPIPNSTPDKSSNSKKSSQKTVGETSHKEKKESVKSLKLAKCTDESDIKKRGKRGRNKIHLSKEYISSESGDSSSSSNEESDNESSDETSSTSENVPLSTLVEQSSQKASERKKRHSVDSACSDISSGQSEDIPLSVLLQKSESVPELKSCILQPDELQENARLLVLDEGLFYAGNITKGDEPDIYGILIDGDRAARPHMFSKEEILNAAVLEVKPVDKRQLPEGTRICAFWSQQYRCLYPGTITKASSPLPDASMLYVEFDDGDSGRIPINDIRMLPPDFPIVSMEPNPFMILGKRRSRAQSQNSCGTNESSLGNEKEKSEVKKQKSSDKISKKSSDDKIKDSTKRKRSPSASNQSRSSSKEVEETKPKKSISEDGKEPKPKKHKKHKEDKEGHHKHHHHHHHKHHHKKHRADKHDRRSSSESVISSCDSPTCLASQELFVLENSKSELTVKIKKSPSPHTNNEEVAGERKKSVDSVDESGEEPVKKKAKKAKMQDSQTKPAKRKERVPSIEKSKIAAFLPIRQLWRWSGKSYRKPGAKGKAKKEFYRSIQRGKETIRVGDCAVFLSTGRPHLPYIGRIETMWESWGGKMDVKVKWFYHPEETKSGKKLSQLKGALFQSPHFDENDVQTISHKCEVLAWDEFQQKKHPEGSLFDNNDTYFLAGTYDPILGTLILEPGVPANPAGSSQDQ